MLGQFKFWETLSSLIIPMSYFFSETLVKKNKIEELAPKLGFTHSFDVDSIGRGGGLAVFWKRRFSCSVVDYSQNFIDLHVQEGQDPVWRLTCFYGYPERSRR